MELSVVLPCRNGARTIGRQLEALARQEWTGRWEVIVSDNGSTDGTRSIAEAYRERLPGLRVVDAFERPGAPHALNVGVRAATGAAVAFCNDDDEVSAGWVAAMGDALGREEFVAGRLEHDRLNEPWSIAIRGRPQTQGLAEWGFLPSPPFGFTCTLGVRRSLHEEIGGFDEELVPAGEDMDYCWRLQLAGSTLRFVPSAVTHYRQRQGLREVYSQARSYGVGNVLVYEKHRGVALEPVAHPWRRGLRAWAGLGKRFLLVSSKTRLGLAVWHLGLRTGMLRASLEHRIVFL
jgi:GT2 family glycosyltransferase